MGNVDSRSKFEVGYLSVMTDKPFFHPGELITGKIYMRMLRPVDASHLDLQVNGKEKGKWLDSETISVTEGDHSRSETITIPRSEERKIFEYKGPCFVFSGGNLMPGDYVVPF